jgi:regulator of protease activity HflC (stomatin/prohibitin superfamily)
MVTRRSDRSGFVKTQKEDVMSMIKGKMALISAIVAFIAVIAIMGSCTGCTRINPGYVGIKISYAGSNRGVGDLPLQTGYVFYNPMLSKVLEWPTFVQTAVWTKSEHEGNSVNEEISFNSKEGSIFTADISLSYQITAEKIPAFYVKFRTDDLNTFTHGYLKNVARDAFNETASTYGVEDIYGPKKEEVLQKVRQRLNDQLKEVGVNILQLGFIGAPRPPDNVTQAINLKLAANQNAQRVENELAQAKAEAMKTIAKAEGEAQANKVLASSISQELIDWKKLELTDKAINKWDGHRPQVEGSGSGILFSVNK